MSGFDDLGLFFVDTFATDENQQDPSKMSLMAVKKKLKDFLRVFHTGNFNYIYRYANIAPQPGYIKQSFNICFNY